MAVMRRAPTVADSARLVAGPHPQGAAIWRPKAKVIEDHPAWCLDIRVIAWVLQSGGLLFDHLACHAMGRLKAQLPEDHPHHAAVSAVRLPLPTASWRERPGGWRA
jgi:hypothetical protein